MGKVTVEGFLSDKEVEELNRNSGGYRIITGANLNPEYIKHTGINGIGPDASDHKQFIKFEYLKSELEKVGFKCFIREGYTSNGELVNENLPISRSL